MSGTFGLADDVLGTPDSLINSFFLGVPQTMPILPNVQAATPVYGPPTASAGETPTVSQFLNAANAEYASGAAPSTLAPFIVDGQQLTAINTLDGMAARAWITEPGQIIIAYSGTTNGDNVFLDPAIVTPEVAADATFLQGQIPPGATDALKFAKLVVQAAAADGISASNVFVTGHSLGGNYAEYTAQQTGLAGIGFEGSGIAKSSTTLGDGSNFVSVVTYGDPFGSYGSDVQGEQPYAPAYALGQAGALPHFGQLVMIGNAADAAGLTTQPTLPPNTFAGATTDFLTDIAANPNFLQYHLPATQAHDLGVTLSNPEVFIGTVSLAASNTSGPVFSVPNDTISQFVSAYQAHFGHS